MYELDFQLNIFLGRSGAHKNVSIKFSFVGRVEEEGSSKTVGMAKVWLIFCIAMWASISLVHSIDDKCSACNAIAVSEFDSFDLCICELAFKLLYFDIDLFFSTFKSSVNFMGFAMTPSTVSGLAGGAGTWTYECKNYGYVIFIVSVSVGINDSLLCLTSKKEEKKKKNQKELRYYQ